jgi:lipopolysaccharide/colanic/teichoic acid biosynthesis glycosyltransferase
MGKRIFDVVCSFAGLAVLAPLFAVTAVLVKSDGGPVFFRQLRVGYMGKLFYIVKFRSMVPGAENMGAQVTGGHDPRITRVGRVLRKTKLDELPQLFNVAVGDMSLVGPRPEVPYYAGMWPPEVRQKVLSVKPGITDYATLYYHDEQAVLAGADDVENVYINEILPHKLALYQQYVKEHSFWIDLRILAATLLKILKGRRNTVSF